MTRATDNPSRDLFWIADSNGRLLHVGEAVEQLFGLTVASLIDDPLRWNEAVVPADAAGLPQPFCADDGETLREYRIIGGDLHTHWLRDRRFSVLDPLSGERRLYGVAEDITEQVAQRELQAGTPLPEGWFSMVAHELRAPLHAIQGWAHVLRQSEPQTALKRKAIDTIERNVLAQARVVDELIDSQHWRDGSLKLDIGMVSLAPLIDAATEVLRSEAAAHQVKMAVEHDESIGAVRGDGERLRLILTRLLSNGLRSTAAGGRVDVKSERAPGLVRITVHDGCTEPLQLPLLFERPQAGDDPSAHRYGSLGLPLVRQLVELHGGRIAANSDGPGFGSTITVELPDRPAASSSAPSPASAARSATPADEAQWGGQCVLVVDDEPDARDALVLSLRKAGAQVWAFGDAASAFAHLSALAPKDLPDLLISDIGMPGENGYAFMRRVRRLEQERGWQPMPAVALTAFADTATFESARAAGFDQQFGKPLNPRTALAALAAVLQPAPRRRRFHRH